MRTFVILVLAATIIASCGKKASSESTAKSGGLEDFEINLECRRSGSNVEICRSYQINYKTGLHIIYRGDELRNAPRVTVLVRAKYQNGIRDARFPMVKQAGGSWYVMISNGCLKGKKSGCEVSGTDEMKNLLYWADGNQRFNALDVEVAFEDNQGHWDSRHGTNYQFNFHQ